MKPISEEMKELKSSVNQLLSIVRSMRNERGEELSGEVRGSGRAGANERAGNEGEREGGEGQREIAAGED